MIKNKKNLPLLLSVLLGVAMLPLAGCDKTKTPEPSTASSPDASANSAAPGAVAYTPPTADQLYQMVGPIALFPDKLIAQVLAGATYPDQITAADNWLAQNKNLTGAALQDAVNQQPWDASVKGLTQFPDVLDQMAKNIAWTSALGDAYVNDPTDVMNAIQVMRQRAAKSGNLKNSKHQKIIIKPQSSPTIASNGQSYTINGGDAGAPPPSSYVQLPGEPPVYDGPEVVPPPPDLITIEPSEPDVVYVPVYNPEVVYGEPLPVYPGYEYAPAYSTGEIVTAGAIAFGTGVLVGAVISDHNWGWNSWGVRWGGRGDWHDGDRGRDRPDGNGGGWYRPAVVHNNNTYVSNSTTIVNRYTNNVNNNYNNNNYTNNNVNIQNNTTNQRFAPNENNNGGNHGLAAAGIAAGVVGAGAAVGIANRMNNGRPNGMQQNGAPASAGNIAPGMRPPSSNGNQPDFNNMNRPHFNANGAGPATSGITNNAPAAPHMQSNTQPNFNTMSKPNFAHIAPNNPALGNNPVNNNQTRPNQTATPGFGVPHQAQTQNRPFGGQQNGQQPGQVAPNFSRPNQPQENAFRPHAPAAQVLPPAPMRPNPAQQPESFAPHRANEGSQAPDYVRQNQNQYTRQQPPEAARPSPAPMNISRPEPRPPAPEIQAPHPAPAPVMQAPRPAPAPMMQAPRPAPAPAPHPAPQQNHPDKRDDKKHE
ncbi:DUF3300 domain-containing protein [Glaciimonas soli]|uniref:DUF3300 domain-containing protein n=1 Tax=Glaciimonas soli TaxID=2590999 RepID=UPI0022410348|nr:DUF3300 domain-containing protein [Glaciimonas soli]